MSSSPSTVNINDEASLSVVTSNPTEIILSGNTDPERVDSGIVVPMSQELSSQNEFITYPDEMYEGIFSQEWISKESDDPAWVKLNELRQELLDLGLFNNQVNLTSQTDVEQNSSEVLAKIKFLLEKFSKTKKPIGMLSRREWSNTVFDEILGIRLSEDYKNSKFIIVGQKKRCRMLTLLCRVYLLLSSNRTATKR